MLRSSPLSKLAVCARHFYQVASRSTLLWAIWVSLLLHLSLFAIVIGPPSGMPRQQGRDEAPRLQISLSAVDALGVKETSTWQLPSQEGQLLPEYGQALDLLAGSKLNWPASSVLAADAEAVLLKEPVFVPSDFSRAEVNLQLELEIDETGLVRQIRVLSGHLSDAEYVPLFAKLGQLQYRPAIQQGRGVASSKIYTITFNAASSD